MLRCFYFIMLFSLFSCFTSPQSGFENTVTGKRVELIWISDNNVNDQHTNVNITNDDVEREISRRYVLSGGSHFHEFNMAKSLMTSLKQGDTVSVATDFFTSNGFHNHQLHIAYTDVSISGKISN